MIAVHCGAGLHSRKHHKHYNRLSQKACKRGMDLLHQGASAMDAVKAAVMVLEDDPITNAGVGSNLTTDGFVEADASIMDGETLTHGGCGAVKMIKNPIDLAYNICVKQSEGLPLGLVPPALLVGAGGIKFAKKVGIKIVSNKKLVSEKALRQLRKYSQQLDPCETLTLDTVGAVCVDGSGRVASACSSGGLMLKHPGRVGQAALYGSGVWADSFSPKTEPSVAVCTTGCGEHLVQTQLAKEIAKDLKTTTCATITLHKSMTDHFIESRYLRNVQSKLCGALVLHFDNDTKEVSLMWGHSTNSMSVGFMKLNDSKPKSMISLLPQNKTVGTTINVGGTYSCLN